jgi:hypothetical protein
LKHPKPTYEFIRKMSTLKLRILKNFSSIRGKTKVLVVMQLVSRITTWEEGNFKVFIFSLGNEDV